MSNVLIGKTEIKKYLHVGWESVVSLIRAESLPVTKINGRWQANAGQLDEWHRARIERVMRQNREFGEEIQKQIKGVKR